MKWNEHSDLKDLHALLSPSKYHWTNYDDDKLAAYYNNIRAKEKGTELHLLASMCIENRVRLERKKKALNLFVNDSIGFRMKTEQTLKYSDNAFGTADAIAFRDGKLRIFDFKSGVVKASFRQLDLYAAYFCLEYNEDPRTIEIIQRIYQYDGFEESIADGAAIKDLMDRTVASDRIIEMLKKQV